MKKKYYNVIMIIFIIFAIISSIYVGSAYGNKREGILADVSTTYACYCNSTASSCSWRTSGTTTYSVIHKEVTDSWSCANYNSQSSSSIELNTCNPGYYWTGSDCEVCRAGNYCMGGTRGYDECPYPYIDSKDKAESVNDCYMYVEAGKQIKVETADKEACRSGEYYPAGRNVKYGEVSKCIKCDGTVTANNISCISETYGCFCDISETSCSWRTSGTAAFPKYREDIKTATSCSNLSKSDQAITNSCDPGYYWTGSDCDACKVGNYCLGGTRGYDQCPYPYSNSKEKAEKVEDCYMYVEAGNQVKNAHEDKEACGSDEYYPAGRIVKYGELSKCIKCDGTVTSNQASCTTETYGCFCDISGTSCSWRTSGTATYSIYRDDIKTDKECKNNTKEAPQSNIDCKPGYYYTGSVCAPCTPGNYCSGGTNSYDKCPAPYSNSNEKAERAEDCFMYVEAGMEIETLHADKKECDSGKYYPGARYVYYGRTSQCLECNGFVDEYKISCNIENVLVPICNSGEYLQNGKCISCPDGYDKSIKGATSINQCYASLSGQEIKERYGSPTDCPIGTSQASISVFYGSMAICSACQGNTYSDISGMAKCKNCRGNVNSEKTMCLNEASSTSCNNGEYLQNGKCVRCPKGYENTPSNATKISDCYAVIEGEEITKVNGQATLCSKGKYQGKKNVNYGNTAFCNDCIGNKTTITTGAKSDNECDVCIKGYVKNNDGECVLGEASSTIKEVSSNKEEAACYLSANNLYVYGKYANDSGFTPVNVPKSSCNKLEIEQLSVHDGSRLQDARFIFQMIDNNDKVIDEKEYIIGYKEIKELTPGNYRLIEKKAPDGYDLNQKEIEIKVGLDGTIYVQLENFTKLVGSNGVRNVFVSIDNAKSSSNNDNSVQLQKCFVKQDSNGENEYCYGEADCEGYTETSSNCNEVPACYLKDDGSYVLGRYNHQKGYTYYGLKCAMCYVNSVGEYYWSDEPEEGENEIDISRNEYTCVNNQKKCYINSNNERFWGYFDNTLGYVRMDDILSETACLDRTNTKEFIIRILYVVIAFLLAAAVIIYLLAIKKTSKGKKRRKKV